MGRALWRITGWHRRLQNLQSLAARFDPAETSPALSISSEIRAFFSTAAAGGDVKAAAESGFIPALAEWEAAGNAAKRKKRAPKQAAATADATSVTETAAEVPVKIAKPRRAPRNSSKSLVEDPKTLANAEQNSSEVSAAESKSVPCAEAVKLSKARRAPRNAAKSLTGAESVLDPKPNSKDVPKALLTNEEVVPESSSKPQESSEAAETATETPKPRRSRKKSSSSSRKESEKLDLGKYFQAVGDDGDIFLEDQVDRLSAKAVTQVPLPVLEVPQALADPAALLQTMIASSEAVNLTTEERDGLRAILERFSERGWARSQALAIYINSKFFPHAMSKFRKFFIAKCPQELKDVLLKVGPCDEAEEYLFPVFAEFCIADFSHEITRYRELVNSADLTKPHAWFPFTRAMKRKVVYHCGPTNSGKTYTALQRFLQARTGIYCCPLRLLAMEIYEKSNISGVYCSLHTGQERREVPFATHLASTVEMAILTKPWCVAVIDEVQMTADEFRGWAWTRAFLALQADEVHLCGDPSTLSLYKTLCAATGDDFTEHHYERFKPLSIDENSARGNFDFIEAGDCVVAFSRKEIFQVKLEVEQRTSHRCCVVYGALPPETRTQQAKLFNDPNSGYDVLVASDAIGMGLNLNIRRVIFNCLDKFNGEQRVPVPASQVKQIAGRAGRRGSLYPEGHVTTLYASDVPYLVECMKQPFEDAASAGLFPVYEQMELFASQLPDITFAQLLDRFSETCRLDGTYFLCKNDNLKKVAATLDKIEGLSLEDRFNFCFAPVNSRDPKSMGTLQRFAAAYSKNVPVRLSMGMPKRTASDNAGIYDLETRHQLLSMYLWLSEHFPSSAFPEKQQAAEMATKIAEMLGESLALFTGEEARKRQMEIERERGAPVGQQQQQQQQQPLTTSMSLKMQAMRRQLCAA